MMERMFAEWRDELIKAGRLKPDQEVDNATIASMFQQLQVPKGVFPACHQ